VVECANIVNVCMIKTLITVACEIVHMRSEQGVTREMLGRNGLCFILKYLIVN
jgi:hypothetical protein